MPIHSVLFVSSGNILRGPIAEAMMRQCLSHVPQPLSIRSAGLDAVEGQVVDPRVLLVAREFSVSLDSHRATPLTGEMVQGADRIVVMSSKEHAELLRRYPDVGGKVLVLEIADPSRAALHDISVCCEQLRTAVRQQAFRLFPDFGRDTGRPR